MNERLKNQMLHDILTEDANRQVAEYEAKEQSEPSEPYEIRAVWKNKDGSVQSMPLSCSKEDRESFRLPCRPDHYGVYHTLMDGTQRHVLDFDDRGGTTRVAIAL